MNWYLVHTKPRQESRALENLQRQGFVCFWPAVVVEKVLRGKCVKVEQSLFHRYLFVQLEQGLDAPSWAPIRSTVGVSRLVTFGHQPAKAPAGLVEQLMVQTQQLREQPQRLFEPGAAVRINSGPFAGLEAVYEMPDGDQRAVVLLTLMSQPVRATFELPALTAVPAC
jgi:transcriptional antiterminator RfaH